MIQNYSPLSEEHLAATIVTVGGPLLNIMSFIRAGEVATKDAFAWVYHDPKISVAASIIFPFLDDLAGHKVSNPQFSHVIEVKC